MRARKLLARRGFKHFLGFGACCRQRKNATPERTPKVASPGRTIITMAITLIM